MSTLKGKGPLTGMFCPNALDFQVSTRPLIADMRLFFSCDSFGDHENIVCVCNLCCKMQCCSLVSKTGCSVAAVPNVLWKDFELICYQNMCVASQLEFWKQQ